MKQELHLKIGGDPAGGVDTFDIRKVTETFDASPTTIRDGKKSTLND